MAEKVAGGPGSAGDGGDEHIGRRWLFGAAVFDELTLELCVEGRPVEVEKKPLEVLEYLLHHAGEVVTKDELFEQVWPGRLPTESVLSRCVSALRSALKDDRREIIKTIHGYGYRLVSEIKVEAAKTLAPPRFTFAVGDSPPLRAHWKLLERLGTGAHGEAWLAEHRETGESRVFKFALNQSDFASLKREITLYRVLRDNLGPSAAIAQIIDWNLEEQPYFLEMEYVAGRDLAAWAEAQGGLANVPMATRLELVAQVAEALAAAHSVGVLHKDLKPANVLVESGRNPTIKLCDFGSGGIIGSSYLEKLGIARLGFTETLNGTRSLATPIYAAPEIIRGHPATAKSDIYALGVILYQILAGDFRKPLTVGWEAQIHEPLLRSDIAETAIGEAADRLPEAGSLAGRLRNLERRRQERVAQESERERTQRALKTFAELRRVRIYAGVLLAFGSIAVAASMYGYRARNEALSASLAAKAVNDFLMEDVLKVDPAVEQPKDTSYVSLLNRAASQVDARFGERAESAARIHWLLGRRYHEIGLIDTAIAQYEAAARLFETSQGRGAEPTMLALDRLAMLYADHGRLPEALSLGRELKTQWASRYGTLDASTLLLRARVARILIAAGQLREGETELREVLRLIPSASRSDVTIRTILGDWLGFHRTANVAKLTTHGSIIEAVHAHVAGLLGGYLLEYADQYAEGELKLRESVGEYSRLFGESEPLLLEKLSLSWCLAFLGKFEESEELVSNAHKYIDATMPPGHVYRSAVEIFAARVRLEQHRPHEAAAMLQNALALCGEGCTPRLRSESMWSLGVAHLQMGNLATAIEMLSRSALDYEQARGANHIGTLKRKIALAGAFERAGEYSAALSTLEKISPAALEPLLPDHPLMAELATVHGRIAQANLDFGLALEQFGKAVEILEHRFGTNDRRTVRARQELEDAKRSTPHYSFTRSVTSST